MQIRGAEGTITPMRAFHRFLLAGVVLGLSSAPRAAVAGEPPGAGSGEAPPADEPRPYHPEPRVIVNVTSVKGPHARADVERAARLAWGRIVSCYKSIDKQAKGRLELELVVAGAGKVTDARRTRSTLRNQKLDACLTEALEGLTMPKARARSIARAEIHVAPGDP
ncbi:MAG TPA: hypothetical protein VGK73_02430 [Polyangiaceae bacterium]